MKETLITLGIACGLIAIGGIHLAIKEAQPEKPITVALLPQNGANIQRLHADLNEMVPGWDSAMVLTPDHRFHFVYHVADGLRVVEVTNMDQWRRP